MTKMNNIMNELLKGNKRFSNGDTQVVLSDILFTNSLVDRQHPKAAIVCCSDSRVVPEYIFDQGIGSLFVIRVAGNVYTGTVKESLEFAVNKLCVDTIVVLSHTNCGAVELALIKSFGIIADEILRSGDIEKYCTECMIKENAKYVAKSIEKDFNHCDVYTFNYELGTRKVTEIK